MPAGASGDASLHWDMKHCAEHNLQLKEKARRRQRWRYMMLYSLLYYLTCCTAYLTSAGAATVSSQAWPAVQLKGD